MFDLRFLQTPSARLTLWIAAISVLLAIGAYVISRVRNSMRGDVSPASDLMTDFRELQEKGELSPEEFKNIKAMLAAKLQAELNDHDKSS